MKKILAAPLALASSVAFSATTVPVQLLNPTGSSSGQTIVSTGASSAPAWGGIGLNGIAAIAANTVLANATGSSAAPTAFAMPSCSTSASALNWTTSTGFTCNSSINAASLGGQTFTSPTITTPNITGITNGSSASAGSVGQIVTASNTAVALTNNTAANITSISLTAGDWDVSGICLLTIPSGTASAIDCGVNTTSATLPAALNYGILSGVSLSTSTGGATTAAPVTQINVTSTTTVYLVMLAAIGTAGPQGNGLIRARRMH